jgi:hypothetical protein
MPENFDPLWEENQRLRQTIERLEAQKRDFIKNCDVREFPWEFDTVGNKAALIDAARKAATVAELDRARLDAFSSGVAGTGLSLRSSSGSPPAPRPEP